MNRKRLEETLKRHEGFSLTPYNDSVGVITIGYGRNLLKGISKEEAEIMLESDIDEAEKECRDNFAFFEYLNESRQEVICNMVFNLGLTRFLGFKKMIKAFKKFDYEEASIQMLDSKWANQVKGRAVELYEQMRTGEY